MHRFLKTLLRNGNEGYPIQVGFEEVREVHLNFVWLYVHTV